MNPKEFKRWLKRVKNELSPYLDIKFNVDGLDWVVGFNMPYDFIPPDKRGLVDKIKDYLEEHAV